MLFELKQVFLNEGEEKRIDYTLSLNNIELDGFYPFKTPVKVTATAKNRAGLVDLLIHTEFTYTRHCDRCFELVQRQMSYDFSHRLVTSLAGDSDDDYIEAPDFTVELDELITSDILLELPNKFLCRDDCKGLCPKCGKSLNDGECNCEKTAVDSRLDILKQLLD
ncbi:MAG: YceD family protein [Acutalibacteraceae bacterium]